MISPQVLPAATANSNPVLHVSAKDAALARPTYGTGEASLPSFIIKRPEGLFVDTTKVGIDDRFMRFVDSVFADGAYFFGLEFVNFNRLLYELEQVSKLTAPVRLATDIRVFTLKRRAIYRAVQLSTDGTSAEYLFEAVFLESIDDPSVSKEVGNASSVILKKGSAQLEPTKLNFDEFVAHLWTNGVRAGIEETVVRRVISKDGGIERTKVALWREPVAGKNAEIEEKNKSLRRDNSPKLLRGGVVDLSAFQNHFPQVMKDELLIRKIPCILGVPGRKVTGELVEAAPPTDLDLTKLAGPGTRVEVRPDGQYIVANLTGFVTIDKSCNQISIAEKIVNRAGVNIRTTGNLKLSGDNYEEFGEVQEQRIVEGKNIILHNDVFGTIISRGGTILLGKNLVNGRASSPGGEITVQGRASAAVLDAPNGTIHIKHAEGCTISGGHLILESATRCQIIGNRVEIGTAAGCIIIAQSATIAVSNVHRHQETVVTMLTPNQLATEKKQTELRKRMTGIFPKLETTRKEIESIRGQKEFGNFLALKERLSKGEIQITPAQQDNLFKITNRFATLTQQLRALESTLEELQRTYSDFEEQLRELKQESDSVGTDIQCTISSIKGETIVRTLRVDSSTDTFSGEGLKALIAKTRNLDTIQNRLFSGSSANFSWRYKPIAEY
ncbi:conserved hypothetical protein [Gammaproteobacteria bacterium]